MKVRALRGVCIGVERHLKPGESTDVDAAVATFLTGIGAVERMPDDPAPVQPITKTEPPAPAGKKEK
jgi:hypothetical protein